MIASTRKTSATAMPIVMPATLSVMSEHKLRGKRESERVKEGGKEGGREGGEGEKKNK